MGRHDRQVLELGEKGQLAIEGARVGIIGCGGLGTNVATALTVAGVRRFVIADPDYPEESNLNRQYVYCAHLGEHRPKAEILAEWMESLDPETDVEPHVRRFDRSTMDMIRDCDILVECLDSFEGRMEANRCAVEMGKPMVHGGIDGFIGEVATVIPGRTPCLQCMMGPVRGSGSTPASIGSVVSAIGSMEATEALKLITGRCGTAGTFLSIDFEKWAFQSIRFDRDPDCPVCGHLMGRSGPPGGMHPLQIPLVDLQRGVPEDQQDDDPDPDRGHDIVPAYAREDPEDRSGARRGMQRVGDHHYEDRQRDGERRGVPGQSHQGIDGHGDDGGGDMAPEDAPRTCGGTPGHAVDDGDGGPERCDHKRIAQIE